MHRPVGAGQGRECRAAHGGGHVQDAECGVCAVQCAETARGEACDRSIRSPHPTSTRPLSLVQVPERFITLAPGSKPRESLSSTFTGKLTVPQAPALHESSRNRSAEVEALQKTGSFKARGATNACALLPAGQQVVTHSSGNHAQAIA